MTVGGRIVAAEQARQQQKPSPSGRGLGEGETYATANPIKSTLPPSVISAKAGIHALPPAAALMSALCFAAAGVNPPNPPFAKGGLFPVRSQVYPPEYGRIDRGSGFRPAPE